MFHVQESRTFAHVTLLYYIVLMRIKLHYTRRHVPSLLICAKFCQSMFALRMHPEVFNEASIRSKVCYTFYAVLFIECVTQKSKGGSVWGKR